MTAAAWSPKQFPITCVVETPYRGRADGDYVEVARHIEYADLCMYYTLKAGFAPFLSHLLFTRVLSDASREDRRQGIDAGTAIALRLERMRVFTDMGISDGMRQRIAIFQSLDLPVEHLELGATTFAALHIERPAGIDMLR